MEVEDRGVEVGAGAELEEGASVDEPSTDADIWGEMEELDKGFSLERSVSRAKASSRFNSVRRSPLKGLQSFLDGKSRRMRSPWRDFARESMT